MNLTKCRASARIECDAIRYDVHMCTNSLTKSCAKIYKHTQKTGKQLKNE